MKRNSPIHRILEDEIYSTLREHFIVEHPCGDICVHNSSTGTFELGIPGQHTLKDLAKKLVRVIPK